MRRKMFTFAAVVSLVLCVATVGVCPECGTAIKEVTP